MANEIARSTHAQLTAMRAAWPQFVAKKRGDGLVVWQGPLRPRGMIYRLSVFWWPGKIDRPYVIIAAPRFGLVRTSPMQIFLT